MTGSELVVWESYSDLAGKPIAMEEICRCLKNFNLRSVLWNCSYISIALQLGMRGEIGGEENYEQLLRIFFDQSSAAQLQIRRWLRGPKRFVFHRRQVLLLAKLAILHCDPVSGIDTSSYPQLLGPVLLAVNDHFHFNTMPTESRNHYDRDDLLGMCTELLSAKEFAHGQADLALVRSYTMCKVVAPKLASNHSYIDIDGCLLKTVGVNYTMLEALTFGAVTRFSTGAAGLLISNPAILPMNSSIFSQMEIEQSRLNHFLDSVSSTTSELRQEARKCPHTSNDLTLFRKSPFARVWFDFGTTDMREGFLLLDQGLLLDKITSTPYWSGIGRHGEAFSQFWGNVFETYVGDVMESACDGTRARYIRSPRLPASRNDEICDGMIVTEDAIVLMEYKSSMFTAKAKYSGSPSDLGLEVRKKLVYSDKDRRPKAVFQLASAVKQLFTKGLHPRNDWCDLASTKRCYAVVVTLDSIGGGVGIPMLLNLDFQEQLAGVNLSCEVRPIYSLDIETLEVASGSFKKATLSEILDRWSEINPSLFTPLGVLRFEDLLTGGPEWLKLGWDELATRAAHTLFPNEVRSGAPSSAQPHRA